VAAALGGLEVLRGVLRVRGELRPGVLRELEVLRVRGVLLRLEVLLGPGVLVVVEMLLGLEVLLMVEMLPEPGVLLRQRVSMQLDLSLFVL